MKQRLGVDDTEAFLHDSEEPLEFLPNRLHGSGSAVLIDGSCSCILGAGNCVYPFVIATIVNGKCTPHVNDFRVFIDDQWVPEVIVAATSSAEKETTSTTTINTYPKSSKMASSPMAVMKGSVLTIVLSPA
jgi:hypothetical protein